MNGYIDTHIHLDFLNDLESQLDEARQAGITTWIVPGTSCERWSKLMEIVDTHAGVYAAPGVHPQASDRCDAAGLEKLRMHLQHPRSVALGEVGLDHQVKISWQLQEKLFIQMIHLAREMNKPLLIHTRRRTERVLELLQQEHAGQAGGIFHAFSGSLETALKIIDTGFALGIGGVITFPGARKLPDVVRQVTAEALVLETDAPDMPPAQYRGQKNRPVHLRLVAEQIASLRGWSLEETARLTTANARRILKLPQHVCPKAPLEGKNCEPS